MMSIQRPGRTIAASPTHFSSMRSIAVLILCLSVCTSVVAQWRYKTSDDKMRGTKTKVAELRSTNRAQLDFPYRGGSTLELTVRKSDKEEDPDVIFWLDRGQIPCLSDCSISAKFDNDEVKEWEGSGPQSHRSDTIFLDSSKDFLARLKSAKRLTVEILIFNHGRFQYTFNTAGLKWE